MSDKTEIPQPFAYNTYAETSSTPAQPNATVYSQPPPPVQPSTTGYAQPPPYGQPPGYGPQPAYGQTVLLTQPGIAQNPYGQPVGQAVLVQNQYGQPVVVQGGVQTVGIPMAIPIPIDPNNPAQNDHPVRTKCPQCQQDITTQTQHVVGGCTWLWCILLAFMGCIFCCFLPFFWNGAKDVVHTCPNCKAEVGRFNRQQRSNVRVHAGGGRRRRRRRR